jgi:hypothetical protein
MALLRNEVPVAYTMMELVESLPQPRVSPFDTFCCTWMAFNAIFNHLSAEPNAPANCRPKLVVRNGVVQTTPIAGVNVPKVSGGSEKDQIRHAVGRLSDDFKDHVIARPAFRFFVNRNPIWQGQRLRQDGNGQPITGVLNVTHTVIAQRPVWTPIDANAFRRHRSGNFQDRDALMKQGAIVLYAVRNNTFHGGKRPVDENARLVVSNALTLLGLIVRAFLLPRNQW